MLPFFLGFLLLTTMIVEFFTVNGSRAEVEQKAPDLARRLFNSVGDQLLHKAGPARFRPLFFEAVPDAIKPTIIMLRYVCAANLIAMSAFGIYVLVFILRGIFSG